MGLRDVAQAVANSHLNDTEDDGIIFGGSLAFNLNLAGPFSVGTIPLTKNPYGTFQLDETCLPATGGTGGIEVVYDFKHQERGIFWYTGPNFNIGSFFNAGLTGYLGKTRGFARQFYRRGVLSYQGYFASGSLSLGVPPYKVPKAKKDVGGLGGVVIEAAPLDSDQNLDPSGVFATYYGAGGGYSAGSPLTADIAVTNYSNLHRDQYLWLSNLGLLESIDKKVIANRKRIGAVMIGELTPMLSYNSMIKFLMIKFCLSHKVS